VAAVHAGYAKRRKPLLEAGIRLFEMKRAAAPIASARITAGSSGSSLHAKVFAVDRSRVFVGSFNFDPRSARLNTESGLVIESPAIAQVIADLFTGAILADAYELGLNEAGALTWAERGEGGGSVSRREPGAGLWRRLGVAGDVPPADRVAVVGKRTVQRLLPVRGTADYFRMT
jgi:Phosphatidylserine/phosphatidylglycerophosphate/cardiolipin synthases and related enzymes